jgi:outer membrane immunogenic protein
LPWLQFCGSIERGSGIVAAHITAAMEETMRKNLVGIAAAAIALSVTGTRAADIYGNPQPYAAVPTAYAYNWTGAYVGGNFGYQWGQLSNSGADPSGILGGFQAGYNWQFGQFVVGAETDFQLSNANDVFANYKFSNPWFGTLRGRAGFNMNSILFYGTLGLAYGRGQVDIGSIGESLMHTGWTAGVGLEIGLTRNWSAKAEYLYIDLGSENYLLTHLGNNPTGNIFRMGVNYRF